MDDAPLQRTIYFPNTRMNHGWSYVNKVSAKQAGKTVLEFYSQFVHSTPEEWKQRIIDQHILLDGVPTTPDTELQRHQELVYHRPPWQEPCVSLEFPILYQDADLWVIDKPSGLPVLPGGQFLDHTVLGQLRLRYPDESLVPIHRLGRGTSGLLLLARSQRARRNLSQQMRDRQIRKIYRTLIGPSSNLPNAFTITQPIGPISYPRLGTIHAATPAGRFAQSHCQVIEQTSEATLMKVRITTGRPHQIRIHLAFLGYPLLGDPLYTFGGQPYSHAQATPSDCGYTLHAHQLAFKHPNQTQHLELESPLPYKLQSLAEQSSASFPESGS